MNPRIILFILFPLFGFSQAPQKVNFQSILRNTNGEIIANKAVSLKISILSGSINGSSVYTETHNKTTDASGLISLQIGNGTVISGIFANIDWGSTAHFIKLEADFNGGSNYVVLGTQELMSVPYALYASKTDTTSLNLVNRFSSKVNVSDTSSMLDNYRTGLNSKAPINNPTFTGTVSGIDKNMVGLGNVDNTTDANKPISTATQTALNNKVNVSDTSSMLANYRTGLNNKVNVSDTSSMLANYRTGLNNKVNVSDTSNMLANYRTGLNNKVNVSDTSSMLNPYLRKADAIGSVETDPVFNSSIAKGITGIDTAYWNRKVNISDTASMLSNYKTGLNNKVNVSDTSSMLDNYRTGLNSKAPINNPTFTGTVSGIDKNMVGLGNVDNTTDANKPISTATQTALNNKLNISDFPLGTTTGNMQYWNGTTWVNLAPGLPGQVISMSATGIPSWSGAAYPTLTTSTISSITPTSANGGGNISSDGGATVSARGLVYGTSANPTLSNSVLTIGSGTGSFSGSITGLTPNTTYYVRAYATNSAGTGYGNEISFQTLPVAVPTLTTNNVIAQSTTASSGGNITDNGGSTVTTRGVVWNTSGSPTLLDSKTIDGSGIGSFVSNLEGLIPNTTYYVRAYATNSEGTKYGNQQTFTTTQTVTDIDGNVYNTVQLGSQFWMSENLKTTKYRNGAYIPNVVGNADWQALTTGAWSYYDHDAANDPIYGKLYNWYTTLGDTLCPTGWGVPTDAEWTVLTEYLGGENIAGGKMKSIGTAYWNSPNTGATNESGFSVLPGGYRNFDGSFFIIRDIFAFFWSATEVDNNSAWTRNLNSSSGNVTRDGSRGKSVGASVRCLRD